MRFIIMQVRFQFHYTTRVMNLMLRDLFVVKLDSQVADHQLVNY